MQGTWLSLWEWSPAGHVVQAFVDVNQWRTHRRTKKKSRSDWTSDRVYPSSPAHTHPPPAWMLQEALSDFHLDLFFRGDPRLSPPVWVRGSGAGGWRFSPGCEQTGFRGWRRCGGSLCEAPGPALLCYPGLRFAALLPFFFQADSCVSPWSLFPESFREEGAHGQTKDLKRLFSFCSGVFFELRSLRQTDLYSFCFSPFSRLSFSYSFISLCTSALHSLYLYPYSSVSCLKPPLLLHLLFTSIYRYLSPLSLCPSICLWSISPPPSVLHHGTSVPVLGVVQQPAGSPGPPRRPELVPPQRRQQQRGVRPREGRRLPRWDTCSLFPPGRVTGVLRPGGGVGWRGELL